MLMVFLFNIYIYKGISNQNNKHQVKPSVEMDIHRPKKVGTFQTGTPLP